MNEVEIFIGSSGRAANHAKALIKIVEEDAKRHAKEIKVIHWSEAFPLTETTFQTLLDTAADLKKKKGYAILLFAPDDLICMNKGGNNKKFKEEECYVTRDNVVFELGLFLGCLGKERVFCVSPNNTKGFHMPTDLKGVTIAPYGHKWGKDITKQVKGAAEEIIKRIYELEGGTRL